MVHFLSKWGFIIFQIRKEKQPVSVITNMRQFNRKAVHNARINEPAADVPSLPVQVILSCGTFKEVVATVKVSVLYWGAPWQMTIEINCIVIHLFRYSSNSSNTPNYKDQMNWNNCNSTLSCDKDLSQVCFDVFRLMLPKINWFIAPNVSYP